MDRLKKLLDKRKKSDWVIFLVFAASIVIGISYVLANGQAKIDTKAPDSKTDEDFVSGTKHSDLKTYFTKQINQKINEQGDKVKLVSDNIDKINKEKVDAISELQQQNTELVAQLKLLQEKVEAKNNLETQLDLPQNYSPPQKRAAFDPNILPPATNVGRNTALNNNYNQENIPANLINQNDEIELVSVELAGTKPDTSFKEITTYLPAGTHIRGIILGGVDAHTEVYGNNQTRVVTIRLKDDGDIPNGFKGQLKNCVLLASAWGNASSERVAMRGERLSCVGTTGKVLETDITATIYGPDGRQDVRGRVVYPEGKLLERAFLSGALSGFGNGLAQTFSTQSISPLGVTSTVAGGNILKSGAATGVGKGLDKLSDYYIKRAEQLQPIIQVGSGTEVDIVIQKGFYLDGRAHTIDAASTPQTPFESENPKDAAKAAANLTLSTLKETM